VSRFKVARLITAAKAQGLVRIEIAGVDDYDTQLAKRLSTILPIDEAVVVSASGTNGFNGLARAAAQQLCTRLRPGDVLGIGWGRTIRAVVEALEDTVPPRPVDVVQLVGALPKTEAAFNPIELASHAANLLGGRLYPLHAPALVESASMRAALLEEPALAETVGMFRHVTVALVGIGALGPTGSSSMYNAATLGSERLRRIEDQGGRGDLFGHVFDSRGTMLTALSKTVIGMEPDEVLRIPTRIGVAGGVEKAHAIRAALAGKLVNVIVTDDKAASAMVGEHDPGG
jgi:DNA-binding transcriptional regulator LsrR (DeoR family)